MATTPNKKQRSRVRARIWHERMGARGLRPIQFWVPDTRTAGFAREAHRQSLAVVNSAHEREVQDFIDAISDVSGA